MEFFCENQHFEICKKSIFSNFQFPPLMLQLKCVILNQRFSNFGLVEFANFDFIWCMRYYRGETKQPAWSLLMGHLLLCDNSDCFWDRFSIIIFNLQWVNVDLPHSIHPSPTVEGQHVLQCSYKGPDFDSFVASRE